MFVHGGEVGIDVSNTDEAHLKVDNIRSVGLWNMALVLFCLHFPLDLCVSVTA